MHARVVSFAECAVSEVSVGDSVLIEVGNHTWVAPGRGWDRCRQAWLAVDGYGVPTTVRRVDREVSPWRPGLLVILWTDHGVIVSKARLRAYRAERVTGWIAP